MKDLNQIDKKIMDFNIGEKRPEALKYTEEMLLRYPNEPRLLYWKAFLLSHIAMDQRDFNKNRFEESIKIYKDIISKFEDKNKLSSQIMLTQLYSILGDDSSIEIAEETYREHQNLLTLNRLIGVLLTFNKTERAKELIYVYEKLSKEENSSQIETLSMLALWWKKIDKEKADKYFKLMSNIKPETEVEKLTIESTTRMYNKSYTTSS